MSAEKTIKTQARQLLRNNYVPAVVALLILLLPYYIIDGTTTALSCGIINMVHDQNLQDILIYSIGYSIEIIAGFLLSPLVNGYVRAFYKASYSGNIDLKDVFYHFKRGNYARALRLNIVLTLKMLLPIILLFSPVIAYTVLTNYLAYDFAETLLYRNIYFILSVLSTTTTVLYSLRYYTVFTVSADNPEFRIKDVFRYNKMIMNEHTGSAARLIFSFMPWLLLCLTILPMLYVIPYLTQSLCISAKWMTQAALEEK